MKKLRYGLLIFAALTFCQIFICQKSAEATGCNDIEIVFADGSGAKIGGTDNNYLDYKNAVSAELKKTGLSFGFYELGSKGYGGYQYPAAGIGIENMKTFFTAVGAFVSAGESYSYGESVDQGVGEVKAYIKEVSVACPNTKFVLSGFSQGAGVISEAITEIDSKNIIYVATFGDAKLYLPEGAGANPLACQGKNLSPYREYVPDCKAYEGILKGRNPYQPNNFGGKLGAWCNYHDVICSSYINWTNLNESFDPHGSYGNSYNADHLFEKAAEKIYKKVVAEFSGETSPAESVQNVAILIDSTGSMSGVINSYKQEALRLAKEVLGNGGSVALYEYRDVVDDNFVPVLHCDFSTCSLEKFESELGKISVSGGGDTPESVLSASLGAMYELEWKRGATKSIIVLTDAGYHPSDIFRGNPITLKDVVEKSLTIDPVNIYTITPNGIAGEYSEVVALTGGKNFTLGELDFSTDFILGRPDVKLSAETYRGETEDVIFFDASNTISAAEILKYEWDLDGDGEFEKTTSEPSAFQIYNEATEKFIQVKATDKNGMFGTMSAKVVIEEKNTEKLPTISSVKYEKISEKSIQVKIETDAFRTLIVVNDTLVGIMDKNEIEIRDFNFSKDNSIVLIPYNQSGYAGERKMIQIEAEKTSSNTQKTSDNKISFFVPKTPNCGAR